jgi:putative transcription factor
MPSKDYHDGMTAPQLSVRSKRARDLAHELSRREGRPIHAIVEEALNDYARRHPSESAAAFLKRMRAVSPPDDQAIVEVEAAIEEHRRPHRGIEL